MSTANALPSQPDEPTPPPVLTAVPEVATRVGTRADALTPVDGLRKVRTAVSAVGSPPDVWQEDRPSLRKIWFYTRHGQWTGEETPARKLATLDAVLVVIPLTTVLYYALWIVERPARRAVAALIGGLIYLVIATH